MFTKRKLCVVVADDDPAVRTWFDRVVHGLGHQLVAVENGRVCIQKLAQVAPDVLFVDLFMPVLDGMHVIRHARENHPKIRIFAMSTLDDTMVIDLVLQDGATAFLIKPLREGDVTEILQRASTGTLPGDIPPGSDI